jgi:hypothetical protein
MPQFYRELPDNVPVPYRLEQALQSVTDLRRSVPTKKHAVPQKQQLATDLPTIFCLALNNRSKSKNRKSAP